MPIDTLRSARTSNISAHTPCLDSSASEYIILRRKKPVVNQFPEKIPKNLLFFHFPAFWTFFGLFFSSARAKRGFNPAISVSKKGLNEWPPDAIAGKIGEVTVALGTVICENRHHPWSAKLNTIH